MSPKRPEDYVKGWNLLRVVQNLPQALGKAKNLGALVRDFQNAVSLLKDYADGTYRNVSKTTIALTTVAVAYVICPLDAVPDFLPFLGFGDDIALFGATLLQIKSELGPYMKWKNAQKKEKNAKNARDEQKQNCGRNPEETEVKTIIDVTCETSATADEPVMKRTE